MEIVYKSIDELTPYENNPRHNENAVAAVAASIKEFNFKVPLVIDTNGVVVAGHTRLLAARQLGLSAVPCIVADDLLPDQIKAFRLADNKVSEFATWEFNALEKELAELECIDFDMCRFGFEQSEIDADDFGDEFSLPDGDKGEICQMTFTLHNEQAELIKYALQVVDDCAETFGNTNKNGNALYEVVRQWAEQRK